ncbi:AbrB/MazE/SpoVT family DNA-binding domain-containing protein [Vulcanococcus limneticus]|uniref:AbrB/MazE/SpoVT family DNA-binding domain-containing protein n=1 Tax=Vulcanococcus limneticus TaxID=2170428 RepID=UPI00398BCFBE
MIAQSQQGEGLAVAKATVEVATLTAKGQVTVPKAVREALGLRQGDQLSWELEDGCVRVRAVAPLDLVYLQGLDATLQEWSSPADDEAFRDL